MSDINVILASNRLQIARDGDDILLDSITYVNVVSVNYLVYDNKELHGTPLMGPPSVTTLSLFWVVQMHLADGRTEIIKLFEVQNQVTWTNDATGYAAAEADIYAAFPSSGGGGGTVTSVGLSAAPSSVFNVSGSPVTGAGTLALSMDNQSANTALMGPTSGGAAAPAFRALVAGDMAPILTTTITDGDTTHAPDGNSVFDALALKQNRLRAQTTISDGSTYTLTLADDTIIGDTMACAVSDPGTLAAGAEKKLKCMTGGVTLTFLPDGVVDGLGSLVLNEPHAATIQSTGSGNWIILSTY